MTLDHLLATVAVRVEPFALCLLDSGWRLRLPGPPDAMFHFVLQGSGMLRPAEGKAHRLERFHLGIVPRGTPHALECGTEVRSVRQIESAPEGDGIVRVTAGRGDPGEFQVACGVVHVDFGDSLGLFQRMRDVVVADLSAYPQVRLAFEGILAEQAQGAPGRDALTAALMNECLVYLLRRLSQQDDCPLSWLTAMQDPILARAIELIFADPAASHTVASLADEVLMSRSVFAERFHAAFDCTPMAFLRDIRLRKAAQLLQRSTGLSINRIGRKVGFSSRSHFSQAFSRRFGVSPAAYRLGSGS